MPLFPTFRRPCPYQADLSAVMDGDWCRMCGQQVHDITDLSDAERAALLGRCDGAICVSYRVPVTLAAAALAGLATPAVASSQAKHHGHHVAQPTPPVITLAGAPMLVPAEPVTPPPAVEATAPSTSATTLAGPRSSP